MAALNDKLFVDTDGQPMCFFLRPCTERTAISGPIQRGGGRICAKYNPKSIRLYPSDVRVIHEVGYSSKFIWDSIHAGRLMDLDNYKMSEVMVTSDDDGTDDEFTLRPPRMVSKKAKGRTEYNYADDMVIINYIIDNRKYRSFGTVNMWKEMEDANILRNRTWQSMKERFRRKILPRIASYKIASGVVEKFNQNSKTRNDHVESDDDDDDDDDFISSSHRSPQSKTRTKYTHKEDIILINYITKKCLVNQVTGNEMWKKMERRRVTNHTWQSMKGRFCKVIVKNLSRYNIDPEAKKMIESYCCKKSEDESSSSQSDRSRMLRSQPPKLIPTLRLPSILTRNETSLRTLAPKNPEILDVVPVSNTDVSDSRSSQIMLTSAQPSKRPKLTLSTKGTASTSVSQEEHVNIIPTVPSQNVNAVPSQNVIAVPSRFTNRRQVSEAIRDLRNSFISEDSTEEDDDGNETFEDIVQDSEPESLTGFSEGLRPPLPLNESEDSEDSDEEMYESVNIPKEIREIMDGTLNSSREITPENHFDLLKRVGCSLHMDHKQLAKLIRFFAIHKSHSFLKRIHNASTEA